MSTIASSRIDFRKSKLTSNWKNNLFTPFVTWLMLFLTKLPKIDIFVKKKKTKQNKTKQNKKKKQKKKQKKT